MSAPDTQAAPGVAGAVIDLTPHQVARLIADLAGASAEATPARPVRLAVRLYAPGARAARGLPAAQVGVVGCMDIATAAAEVVL